MVLRITKKQKEGALMEQMASDLKLVLEYTSRIPKIEEKLEKHDEMLEKIQDDVEAMKVGQKKFDKSGQSVVSSRS